MDDRDRDPFDKDDAEALAEYIRKEHINGWCEAHGWKIGVAEVGLGAALLAAGLHAGVLEIGHDLLLSYLSPSRLGEILGVGGGLGGIALYLLGNCGLAVMGTAYSVPAALLALGGAFIFSLAGYGLGTLVKEFLLPAVTWKDLLGPGSLAAVGIALLIDGARRIAKDERLQESAGRVWQEARVRTIDTFGEFNRYCANVLLPLEPVQCLVRSPGGAALVATVGVAGAAHVTALSSVTVLGSKTLGAVLLNAGLVAAPPLWPILLTGALAGTAVYAAGRFLRDLERTPPDDPPPPMDWLALPSTP